MVLPALRVLVVLWLLVVVLVVASLTGLLVLASLAMPWWPLHGVQPEPLLGGC